MSTELIVALVLITGGGWLAVTVWEWRIRRDLTALATELHAARELGDLPVDGAAFRHRLPVDGDDRVWVRPLGPIEVPGGWVALKGASEAVDRVLRQTKLIGGMRPREAEVRVVLWRPSLGAGSWVVVGTCGPDGAASWQHRLATAAPPRVPAVVTFESVVGGLCPMDRLLWDYPQYPVDGAVYEATLVGYWISTSASPAVFAAASLMSPTDDDRAMIDRLLGTPVTGEPPPSEAVEAQPASIGLLVRIFRPVDRLFRAIPLDYAIAATVGSSLLELANMVSMDAWWIHRLVGVASMVLAARFAWEGHTRLRRIGAAPILGHGLVAMVVAFGVIALGSLLVSYPMPVRVIEAVIGLTALSLVAIAAFWPAVLVDLAERLNRQG